MAADKPKKNYPCLKCDEHVKKNQESVQCMFCEFWTHKKCAGLTNEVFNFLVKTAKATGNVQYICTACTSTCTALSKKINPLDKEIKIIDQKVNDNSKDIQKCLKSVDEIQKKLPDLSTIQANSSSVTQDSVFQEIRDREMRKNNVIIHNLPELDDRSPQARKSHDMDQFKDIMNTISCKLEDKDIKYMNRIGEKRDSDRPLLVCFRNHVNKTMVQESARFLKSSKWNEISIIPDLTKRQRKEEEVLRTEMERKNKEMDKEDFLSWEWRMVGARGERRLVKTKKALNGNTIQRNRSRVNLPTNSQANPNTLPLGPRIGSQKRKKGEENLMRNKKTRESRLETSRETEEEEVMALEPEKEKNGNQTPSEEE